MGTPTIAKDSALAKELAAVLRTTVSSLISASDGQDEISFLGLKNSDGYGARIEGGGVGHRACENAFVVDNGDGRIGAGDIFLHADGFYQDKGEYAFRFSKLFAPRTVQEQSGYTARNNAFLPPEAAEVLEAIEKKKGKSIDMTTAALKMVCE